MAALLASMLHHGLHEVKTKTQEPSLSQVEPRIDSKIFRSSEEILKLVVQGCNRLLSLIGDVTANPAVERGDAARRLRLHMLTAALLLTKAHLSRDAATVTSAEEEGKTPKDGQTSLSAPYQGADRKPSTLRLETLVDHCLVTLQIENEGVESDGEDVSAHLTGIAISLLSSLLPSFPPKHEEPVVQLSISQRQSLVHAIFGVLRVWGRKFDSALASLQSKVERHQGLLHSGSVLLSSEAGAAQLVHSSAANLFMRCCYDEFFAPIVVRSGYTRELLADPILLAWKESRSRELEVGREPPPKKGKSSKAADASSTSRGTWSQLEYFHCVLRGLVGLLCAVREEEAPTLDTVISLLHFYHPLLEVLIRFDEAKPSRPKDRKPLAFPTEKDLQGLTLFCMLLSECSRYGYMFHQSLGPGLSSFLRRFKDVMRRIGQQYSAPLETSRRTTGILSFTQDSYGPSPLALDEGVQLHLQRLLTLWEHVRRYVQV